MSNESLRNGIALVVVAVWATTALSTLLTKDYTALGAVTPVMMIVVGFLFGYKSESKKVNGNGKKPDNDLSDWGG